MVVGRTEAGREPLGPHVRAARARTALPLARACARATPELLVVARGATFIKAPFINLEMNEMGIMRWGGHQI